MLRAEPLGEANGGDVVGSDAMDDVGPAELVEGEVDRRDGGLARVAATGELAQNAPADLGPGPAFRLPWARATNPAPARALDQREHRKAADRPGARHRADRTPRGW